MSVKLERVASRAITTRRQEELASRGEGQAEQRRLPNDGRLTNEPIPPARFLEPVLDADPDRRRPRWPTPPRRARKPRSRTTKRVRASTTWATSPRRSASSKRRTNRIRRRSCCSTSPRRIGRAATTSARRSSTGATWSRIPTPTTAPTSRSGSRISRAVIQQQNDVKRRPPTEVTDQDHQRDAHGDSRRPPPITAPPPARRRRNRWR